MNLTGLLHAGNWHCEEQKVRKRLWQVSKATVPAFYMSEIGEFSAYILKCEASKRLFHWYIPHSETGIKRRHLIQRSC